MNSRNITNIGANNFNLSNVITNLNSKTINLDSNGKIDYSNVLNTPTLSDTEINA